MHGRYPSVRMIVRSVCLAMAGLLSGCVELQHAAEGVAQQSGNPQLAGSIRGVGTAIRASFPISYDEEQAIGSSIALQVVGRYGGLYDKPNVVRYVNLVGRAVALTCDRANIDYHFGILNHESINAFATPGGYVFLTRGLLGEMTNEAELAAVLAHEIAHISEKHILKLIQREKQLAGVAEAGLSYVSSTPEVFRNLIDTTASTLLDKGLGQNLELDADRLGVVFAARVGYDPTAYEGLLNRLKATQGEQRAFLKTHPNFATRLAAVQSVLQKQHLASNGAFLADRFSKVVERRR